MFIPNLDIKPGQDLDDFHLDRVVATSGMATVFEAHVRSTGQRVAIKVPHPEVESDPVLWERFRREEDIGIRLHHPGVMKVHPNPDRSQVYMVMDWVEGLPLRQILSDYKAAGTPMPIDQAIAITIAACHALEHIHANGVVHRDLKPENIMVDGDSICLIDFGIASSAAARRLTYAHFSQSLGTPDYISPEQVRGKRGDARSDVFAMGAILYEMLTGNVPYTGPSPLAVMNDRLLNAPRAPRELRPEISPELQEIVFRALEPEPKNRYANAREMVNDLQHPEQVGVQHRDAISSRPRPRRSPQLRRVLMFALFSLIPIAIFVVLLIVAHRQQ